MSRYQLLDCGDGSKWERLGDVFVVRQATQAVWRADASTWKNVDARHHRSKHGGGHWEFLRPLPDAWVLEHGGIRFHIKLTSFGHIGLFPEQDQNWQWLSRRIHRAQDSVINLFGYTGGSTLVAAEAGAQVTHVDASKGVVQWARDNADLNGLGDAPIRWIVDDVARFVARECRRETRYDGVILDPPSFGRGKKGEVWKIEQDLVPLLQGLKQILKPRHFGVLSCHTPGYTPRILEWLVRDVLGDVDLEMGSGEMDVDVDQRQQALPSGSYLRWSTRLPRAT